MKIQEKYLRNQTVQLFLRKKTSTYCNVLHIARTNTAWIWVLWKAAVTDLRFTKYKEATNNRSVATTFISEVSFLVKFYISTILTSIHEKRIMLETEQWFTNISNTLHVTRHLQIADIEWSLAVRKQNSLMIQYMACYGLRVIMHKFLKNQSSPRRNSSCCNVSTQKWRHYNPLKHKEI